MNQKKLTGKKMAKILKEKSVSRRHYETNIISEPFEFLSIVTI